MPEWFLSAWPAWIALVVSIVSPVVTTIVTVIYNGHFQFKMKGIELLAKRKLDVIENYLKYASSGSYSIGVSESFSEYKSLIFLYAPSSIHDKIRRLNKLVETERFSDEAAQLLEEVAVALRKENVVCRNKK